MQQTAVPEESASAKLVPALTCTLVPGMRQGRHIQKSGFVQLIGYFSTSAKNYSFDMIYMICCQNVQQMGTVTQKCDATLLPVHQTRWRAQNAACHTAMSHTRKLCSHEVPGESSVPQQTQTSNFLDRIS